MKKGYENRNAKIYAKIMALVCGNYKMDEADLDAFMSVAIPQLPKKMIKKLEKFFGIDGGINHFENIQKKISKGKKLQLAEEQMRIEVEKILRKLGTLDYLMLFRKDTKELVQKIAKKCEGKEESITKTKWAMIYALIIYGGPYFFCDEKKIGRAHV